MTLPEAPEPHPEGPIPAPIMALLEGTDAAALGEIERETRRVADRLRATAHRCGSIMPVAPHHPEQGAR